MILAGGDHSPLSSQARETCWQHTTRRRRALRLGRDPECTLSGAGFLYANGCPLPRADQGIIAVGANRPMQRQCRHCVDGDVDMAENRRRYQLLQPGLAVVKPLLPPSRFLYVRSGRRAQR